MNKFMGSYKPVSHKHTETHNVNLITYHKLSNYKEVGTIKINLLKNNLITWNKESVIVLLTGSHTAVVFTTSTNDIMHISFIVYNLQENSTLQSNRHSNMIYSQTIAHRTNVICCTCTRF